MSIENHLELLPKVVKTSRFYRKTAQSRGKFVKSFTILKDLLIKRSGMAGDEPELSLLVWIVCLSSSMKSSVVYQQITEAIGHRGFEILGYPKNLNAADFLNQPSSVTLVHTEQGGG